MRTTANQKEHLANREQSVYARTSVGRGAIGPPSWRNRVRGRLQVSQSVLRLVGRDDQDKQRALEAALSQIDRAFGKGSVMKLGEKGKIVEIESVSTGSLGLDLALGIGGLPKGRIVEIYGPESSGKTTLALHVVAEVQKAG